MSRTICSMVFAREMMTLRSTDRIRVAHLLDPCSGISRSPHHDGFLVEWTLPGRKIKFGRRSLVQPAWAGIADDAQHSHPGALQRGGSKTEAPANRILAGPKTPGHLLADHTHEASGAKPLQHTLHVRPDRFRHDPVGGGIETTLQERNAHGGKVTGSSRVVIGIGHGLLRGERCILRAGCRHWNFAGHGQKADGSGGLHTGQLRHLTDHLVKLQDGLSAKILARNRRAQLPAR